MRTSASPPSTSAASVRHNALGGLYADAGACTYGPFTVLLYAMAYPAGVTAMLNFKEPFDTLTPESLVVTHVLSKYVVLSTRDAIGTPFFATPPVVAQHSAQVEMPADASICSCTNKVTSAPAPPEK